MRRIIGGDLVSWVRKFSVCLAGLLFSSTLAVAESPFASSTRPIFQNTVHPLLVRAAQAEQSAREVFERYRDKPGFQQKQQWHNEIDALYELSDTGLGEVGTALAEVQSGFAESLDLFDTESGKRLTDLKARFHQTLQEFKEASEVREATAALDPDMLLERVGPWLPPLIRACVLEGGRSFEHVMDLLELAAAGPNVVRAGFIYAQIFALAEFLDEELHRIPLQDPDRKRPVARMALDVYLKFRADLQRQVARLQAIFPGFPNNANERTRTNVSRKELFQELNAFVGNFAQPVRPLPKPTADRIRSILESVFYSAWTVERFAAEAFPNLKDEEESFRLTKELLEKPQFQACAPIAQGTIRSDLLEWSTCDIPGFMQAVRAYTDFHEKQAGYGILPALVQLIADNESDLLGGKTTWEKVEQLADEEIRALGSLNEETLAAWPRLKASIFSNATLLSALLGNGLGLHDYLAGCFLKSGINPLLGRDTAYTPTLHAAHDILNRFSGAIPSNLNQIERLSSVSDCRVFDKGDSAESPYVLWTQAILPVDEKQGVWTQSAPSTNGFYRLLWMHQIKVGNAVHLPRTAHPDLLLAGSLKWTAISRYLANYVLLLLFNGEEIKDETLRAIGISDAYYEFDALFQRRRMTPALQTIITEAKRVFFTEMLPSFAANNSQLVTPEIAEDPKAVLAVFRHRYREELALAAKQRRRWGKDADLLNQGNTSEERYQAIQLAPRYELCRLFGVPPGSCPEGVESGLHMSLMRDLFPTIRQGYFERHTPRRSGERADDWRRRVQNQAEGLSITPDMFMEELVMHKGVIGGNKPVPGLESEEINRYKKYREWIPEDQYVLWAGRITQLQRIYGHTQNIFERRKSDLKRMSDILFHLFPPLKVEMPVPGHRGQVKPVWEWFDGDPGHFDAVMAAFAQTAADLINEIQTKETSEEILDMFLPVLALVDQTLGFFPENKTQVCSEYASRRFWQNVQQGALVVTEIAGAAAVGLGPVGVAVGAGAVGVALAADYYGLRQQRQELARNKAHELASWSQVSLETSAGSTRVIDALERAYASDESAFYTRLGTTLPLVGFAAVKNLAVFGRVPRAANRASEAYITSMRAGLGLKAMQPADSWRYWGKFGGRLTRAVLNRDIKPLQGALRQLLRSLDRRLLLQRRTYKTLAEHLGNPLIKSTHLWDAEINEPWALFRWSLDVFGHAPASLVGRSVGPGITGNIWRASLWTGLGTLVVGGVNYLVGDLFLETGAGAREKFWDEVQRQPDLYEPLLLRVLNSEISPDNFLAIVRADKHYRKVWETAFNEALFKGRDGTLSRGEVIQRLQALRAGVEESLDEVRDEKQRYPREQELRALDRKLRELGAD